MYADVPLPPLGSIGAWGRVEGELKTQTNQKIGGCLIRAVDSYHFYFCSALPDVVQYVGHRPAHILV